MMDYVFGTNVYKEWARQEVAKSRARRSIDWRFADRREGAIAEALADVEKMSDEDVSKELVKVYKSRYRKAGAGKLSNKAAGREMLADYMSRVILGEGKGAERMLRDMSQTSVGRRMLNRALETLRSWLNMLTKEGRMRNEVSRSIRALESALESTKGVGETAVTDSDRHAIFGEKGAENLDTHDREIGKEESATRMENLGVAREMERETKDALAIRMATGWERGADGEWRYEVPDGKIKEQALKEFEDETKKNWKLEEFWDAPELFAAYPQLKNMPIKARRIRNLLGQYNSSKEEITLSTYYVIKDLRSVMAHEIQHAIQDIEGFAAGTTERPARLYLNALVRNKLEQVNTKRIGEIESADKEMQNLRRRFESGEISLKEYSRLLDEREEEMRRENKEYGELRKDWDEWERLAHINDKDAYRNAAGEVEARNVQERLKYTDKKRREKLLEETESVPREKQLAFTKYEMADVLRRDGWDVKGLDKEHSENSLEENEGATKDVAEHDNPDVQTTRYSVVTEPELKSRLEDELLNGKEGVDYIVAYRAARKINGKYYSPKMTRLAGVGNEIVLGKVEQSDERPDLAYEHTLKGGVTKYKINLDGGGKEFNKDKRSRDTNGVDYNPYIHCSDTPLNDQFTAAWDMDDMCVLEVRIPLREIDAESPYKAEKANLAVGRHKWKGGSIDNQMPDGMGRQVILTRYDLPMRELPAEEAANLIAQKIRKAEDVLGHKVRMPFNVFTPKMQRALMLEGVMLDSTPVGSKNATPVEEVVGVSDNEIRGNKKNPQKTRQDLTTSSLSDADVAKLKIISGNLETLKSNFANHKDKRGILTDISNAIGATAGGDGPSRYAKITLPNLKEAEIRISNHNANAKTFAEHEHNDNNISIVIKSRRSRNTFKAHPEVALTEYVYTKEAIAEDGNLLSGVVDSLRQMLEIGEYVDLTGKALVNHSPEHKKNGGVPDGKRYNVTAEDVKPLEDAYNSAIEKGKTKDAKKALDPSIVKRADTITYDSNGDVIPLSKRFDVSKNDIRYSTVDEGGIEDDVSRQTKSNRDLIAVHNLSEQKLLKAMEIGGFPMPSIAITKGEIGHTNFGDISLVFDKGTINPIDKRNKVYSNDAWTPAFPRIEVKLNEKARAEEGKRIKKALGAELFDGFQLGSELHTVNVLDKINGLGDIERFYYSDWLRLAYMRERGIDFDVPRLTLTYYGIPKETIEIAKRMGYDLMDIKNEGTYKFFTEHPDFVDEIKQAYVQDKIKNVDDQEKRDLIAKRFESGFDYNVFNRIIGGAIEMQRDLANGGVKTRPDLSGLSKIANENVDPMDADYIKWVNELFDGVIEKRGLRNEKDAYTPSGYERNWEDLHDDFTIDNIVKAMLRDNPTGGKGFFGRSFLGASASEYGSIEEIRRRAKTNLREIEPNLYHENAKELKKQFDEIVSRVVKRDEKMSFEQQMDASVYFVDAVSKHHKAKDIYKALHKDYPTLTMADAHDLEIAVKAVQKAATRFFEAKPQRAVGFDEVKLAVVPEDTNPRVVDALKSHGIEIRTYERGNDRQRVELVDSATKEKGLRFNVSEDDDVVRYNKGLFEKTFGGVWIDDKQEFAKFASATVNNRFENDGIGYCYTNNNFYCYYRNNGGDPVPYIIIDLHNENSQEQIEFAQIHHPGHRIFRMVNRHPNRFRDGGGSISNNTDNIVGASGQRDAFVRGLDFSGMRFGQYAFTPEYFRETGGRFLRPIEDREGLAEVRERRQKRRNSTVEYDMLGVQPNVERRYALSMEDIMDSDDTFANRVERMTTAVEVADVDAIKDIDKATRQARDLLEHLSAMAISTADKRRGELALLEELVGTSKGVNDAVTKRINDMARAMLKSGLIDAMSASKVDGLLAKLSKANNVSGEERRKVVNGIVDLMLQAQVTGVFSQMRVFMKRAKAVTNKRGGLRMGAFGANCQALADAFLKGLNQNDSWIDENIANLEAEIHSANADIAEYAQAKAV